ncbi:MAG: outer membrane protease [Chlamydiales bacterium]|jgi:outer membrane protease
MRLIRSISKMLVLFICFPFLLLASKNETQIFNSPNFRLQLGLDVSLLNGEARETVYDTDQDRRKISELFWDLKEIPMVGVHLRSDIFDDFRIDLNAKTNVAQGSGIMTDWDWLHPTDPSFWTNFSQSSVEVKDAQTFDLNASYAFFKFDEGRGRVRAIGGFKYLFWKWEDHIDYLVYSSNAGGGAVRDIFIPKNGERGIDYQQHFSIPYFGVGAEFPYKSFIFDLHILYSPFVVARDRDYHILRDLLFEEKANNGQYYSFGGEAKWNVFKDWFLGLNIQYERVKEMRADTFIIVDPYPHLIIPNSAGIAYDSYQVGISISKKI